MPFYRCLICQEDGSPVAESIQVVIEETTRGAGREWWGTITATAEAGLEAGRKYQLTLEDGRTGRFHVRRNTMAGGQDRSVAIIGIGPLARSGV